MPFWRAYYHLVWATKNREPLIQPNIEPRLHSYLVNKAKELGVHVYAINGWVDHVHLIVAIPPKLSVAEVVKRLKGASSFDINKLGESASQFNWQRGYGVLTLGEKQRPAAEMYVHNQKTHHQHKGTNSWLERMDEFDEGPLEEGLPIDIVPPPPVLKEAGAVYTVNNADDFPF